MLSPLVLLVLFAFSDKQLLTFPITGLTTEWFVKVYENPKFWIAFEKSMIVTGTVGLVSTVIGTMAAAAALAHAAPQRSGRDVGADAPGDAAAARAGDRARELLLDAGP